MAMSLSDRVPGPYRTKAERMLTFATVEKRHAIITPVNDARYMCGGGGGPSGGSNITRCHEPLECPLGAGRTVAFVQPTV